MSHGTHVHESQPSLLSSLASEIALMQSSSYARRVLSEKNGQSPPSREYCRSNRHRDFPSNLQNLKREDSYHDARFEQRNEASSFVPMTSTRCPSDEVHDVQATGSCDEKQHNGGWMNEFSRFVTTQEDHAHDRRHSDRPPRAHGGLKKIVEVSSAGDQGVWQSYRTFILIVSLFCIVQ